MDKKIEKELLDTITCNHKENLKLTHLQEQVVLGSLLGKGMIIKPPGNREYYFRLRQSTKEDINILAYKAAEIKNFSRPKSFLQDENNYYWNSISHAIWKDLYNFCYKDNKKNITMQWLDKLTQTALAIYYLDVGRIRNKIIELNLGRCSSKELICKFFNEVSCKCELQKNKLVFTKEGSKQFIKIIEQSIPSYLLYKISG